MLLRLRWQKVLLLRLRWVGQMGIGVYDSAKVS